MPGVIIDLGCGDGATIWALDRRGLLGETTWAVDLSAVRVKNATEAVRGVRGVVADAVAVPLPDNCADGVICSQVIEHVADEHALVAEMARLLRPGGWWYVGTVMRGPRAWWFYRVNGIRRLDPTHAREYESEDEFRSALEHPGIAVADIRATPLHFPVSDLAIRVLGRGRRISNAYRKVPESVRSLRIRVPGYFLLEASGTRRPHE